MNKDAVQKLKDYVFGSETYVIPGKGQPSYYREDQPNIIERGLRAVQGIISKFGSSQPTPSPTPQQQYQAPKATPVATPQQQYQGQGFRVQVPLEPGYPQIPDDISQILGNELDRYGLATEAARVLTHPREQTYTAKEIQQYGHDNWNGGENPQFNKVGTTLQNNGTYDVGLMRNNTGTFKLLQGSHKWNTRLKDNGITDVSQLDDPAMSVRYAKILGDWYVEDLGLPRWMGWFAAPLNLRTSNDLASNQ